MQTILLQERAGVGKAIHQQEPGGRGHHPHPGQVIAIGHLLQQVESNCLVFGFLNGMPEPELAHAGIDFFQYRRVGQQPLGHDRRDVLQSRRGCQLFLVTQTLTATGDDLLSQCLTSFSLLLVTGGRQHLVEGVMLQGMHGLLADKTGDLLLLFLAGGQMTEVPHGIHEEALAIGEGERQRIEQMGLHRLVVEPVFGGVPEIKIHPLGNDGYRLRRGFDGGSQEIPHN